MKTLIAYIDPVQKYVSEESEFSMYIGGPQGEAGIDVDDETFAILKTIPLFNEHVASGLIEIRDEG